MNIPIPVIIQALKTNLNHETYQQYKEAWDDLAWAINVENMGNEDMKKENV